MSCFTPENVAASPTLQYWFFFKKIAKKGVSITERKKNERVTWEKLFPVWACLSVAQDL
jgi:hypothetical protein